MKHQYFRDVRAFLATQDSTGFSDGLMLREALQGFPTPEHRVSRNPDKAKGVCSAPDSSVALAALRNGSAAVPPGLEHHGINRSGSGNDGTAWLCLYEVATQHRCTLERKGA